MSKFTIDSFEEYTRYKYVIENIKDIIWEMNTNMVFTFISPTVKEATGYEADEMVGRCLLDFLSKESKEYAVNQVKQNMPKRVNGDFTKIIFYDIEFVCKDGNVIMLEISVKPVFNENIFIGYIGTSRDVSEKKAYQDELTKYIEELKYKNEKLEELATLDMLTGAYNRRKFEYYVILSVDKKEKYGSPFSIIMLDIDHFKQVNDQYGHKKGDQILQELSAIVKLTLRDTDKLFRWGGEEFIILLPETTLRNAYKVAEKVRKSIETNDFGMQDNKVTVSLGVGDYKKGESIDQFVSSVDNALLKAKSNGRNRVEYS